MNPFFRYCRECDVLWQGTLNSMCWLCDGPGTQCQDTFVYTAPSMNAITSEL